MYNARQPTNNQNSLSRQSSKTGMNKRLSDEELPGIVFIVTGALLAALGIAHALISWWHIAYCMIWTGVLVSLI